MNGSSAGVQTSLTADVWQLAGLEHPSQEGKTSAVVLEKKLLLHVKLEMAIKHISKRFEGHYSQVEKSEHLSEHIVHRAPPEVKQRGEEEQTKTPPTAMSKTQEVRQEKTSR